MPTRYPPVGTEPDLLLERFLLALACYREARGESLLGKMLVAQVIRNRVDDVRWPGTYRGVILQPKQFSAFNPDDPNVTKFPALGEQAWLDSVLAADRILNGSGEPFTLANHYCVSSLRPSWYDEDKIVAREGHHTFFAL